MSLSAQSSVPAPSTPKQNMPILPGSPSSRPVASHAPPPPMERFSVTPTRDCSPQQVALHTTAVSPTAMQTPPQQSQPILRQSHTDPHVAVYDPQVWIVGKKRAFIEDSRKFDDLMTAKRLKTSQVDGAATTDMPRQNLFEIGTSDQRPMASTTTQTARKPRVSFTSETTDDDDATSASQLSSTAASSTSSTSASPTISTAASTSASFSVSLISVASVMKKKKEEKEKETGKPKTKPKEDGKNEKLLDHLFYAKDLPTKPKIEFKIINSDTHGPFTMDPDKSCPIYKPSCEFWPTRSELANWKKDNLLKPKVEGEDTGIPSLAKKDADVDSSGKNYAAVDDLAKKVFDAIIDVKFFYCGIKAPVTQLLTQGIKHEALIAVAYEIVEAAIKYHTEGFDSPVWAQLNGNHPRGRKKEQDNSFQIRIKNIILALRHHKNVVMDAVEGKTSLFYALIIAPLASFQAKSEWAKSNNDRAKAFEEARDKSRQFEEAREAQKRATASTAEVAIENAEEETTEE